MNADAAPPILLTSVTGWARAGALVGGLAPTDGRPLLPHLAHPGRLVAASRSDCHPSPRDTRALLATVLHLPVEEHDDDEESLPALAESLHRSDRAVLVSWRHGSLPALAAELLQRLDAAPARWPENRFDVLWVVERDGFSRHLVQVPLRLPAGDRAQPIARRVGSACAKTGEGR